MKNKITTFLQILSNAGYTQQEIADKIGVSVTTINRFMAGKISPSIDTLVNIADAFSVSTDAVLGREPAEITMNVKKQWERKKALCASTTITA